MEEQKTARPKEADLDRVIILRTAALSVQVCASIPPERISEVILKTNVIHPCGTMNGWVDSGDPEHAPIPCGDIEGRWHYVFVC